MWGQGRASLYGSKEAWDEASVNPSSRVGNLEPFLFNPYIMKKVNLWFPMIPDK